MTFCGTANRYTISVSMWPACALCKKKKSDLVLELNIYFTCPGEKIVLLDIVSSDKETAYISLWTPSKPAKCKSDWISHSYSLKAPCYIHNKF